MTHFLSQRTIPNHEGITHLHPRYRAVEQCQPCSYNFVHRNSSADGNESSGRKTTSNCSVSELFASDGGSVTIKSMCKFTVAELDKILLMASGSVCKNRIAGRGQKRIICEKDKLFICLCVL